MLYLVVYILFSHPVYIGISVCADFEPKLGSNSVQNATNKHFLLNLDSSLLALLAKSLPLPTS